MPVFPLHYNRIVRQRRPVGGRMSRYQRGHIYEAFGAFHVRFYQTELRDGQLTRVQNSHRLCARRFHIGL